MGNAYVLYAVISREGKLKRKVRNQGRGPMIYDTLPIAQRQCRSEGDSVVQVVIRLDQEPLFIRKMKVRLDGDD